MLHESWRKEICIKEIQFEFRPPGQKRALEDQNYKKKTQNFFIYKYSLCSILILFASSTYSKRIICACHFITCLTAARWGFSSMTRYVCCQIRQSPYASSTHDLSRISEIEVPGIEARSTSRPGCLLKITGSSPKQTRRKAVTASAR